MTHKEKTEVVRNYKRMLEETVNSLHLMEKDTVVMVNDKKYTKHTKHSFLCNGLDMVYSETVAALMLSSYDFTYTFEYATELAMVEEI